MTIRFTGLWRHREFMKLWIGETISLIGSQITLLAIPLTAALTLNASPREMGLLTAIEYLPFILLSLFAGVWVDRMRKQPLLVGTNIGRALILISVPILTLLNVVGIEFLYVVGFLHGVLTVFFEVAYPSYLPAVVTRNDLVEANGKLQSTFSIAHIVGPGLAGSLISLLTAPFAIVFDAASFLVSALFLGAINVHEEVVHQPHRAQNVWSEVGEGLRLIFNNVFLRSIATSTGIFNFFDSMALAAYLLYLTRELNISPTTIGFIYSIGSVGALIGSLIAPRIAKRFGMGPAIVWSIGVGSLGGILVPLASGPWILVLAFLAIAQFIQAVGVLVYNVNQVSMRQQITPERLLGRMTASMRFIIYGVIPLGSLVGGVLGEWYGLWPILVIASLGRLIGFLPLFFSPLVTFQEQAHAVTNSPE